MGSNVHISSGVANDYTIRPKNLVQYNAFRGVIDFSQPGQFDQFETGYSFLSVIKQPEFMKRLADNDAGVKQIVESFNHMLEYEFRGLSGLPDLQGDGYEVGDGTNTVKFISNVTRDTSVELSSTYYERRGSLITKYMELYLTGIKDPMSKAKTYHGLIRSGVLQPSFENEVATLMYMVTDNTMLRLERAYLLTDVQFTKAEESMYDSTKGDINNREVNISFNCFPIMGKKVDKAAKALLQDITGVQVTTDTAGNPTYQQKSAEGTSNGYTANAKRTAVLDSMDYTWGIMDKNGKGINSSYEETLGQALSKE